MKQLMTKIWTNIEFIPSRETNVAKSKDNITRKTINQVEKSLQGEYFSSIFITIKIETTAYILLELNYLSI